MKKTIIFFLAMFITISANCQTSASKSGLPNQSGHSGQYLTTNGTTAKWETVTAGFTGTGTENYLPMFSSSTTLSTSIVFQNSNNIGINQIDPSSKLHIKTETNTSSSWGLKINSPNGNNVFAARADGFCFAPDLQIGNGSGDGTLSVYGNQGGSSDIVRFYNSTASISIFEFRQAANNSLLYCKSSTGVINAQISGSDYGGSHFTGHFSLKNLPTDITGLISGELFRYANASSPSGWSIGIMP